MGEMGLIPGWAVSGLVGSCLPSGQRIEAYPYGVKQSTSEVDGDGTSIKDISSQAVVYMTDGMNNVAKLKRMKLKAQLNNELKHSNQNRNCEVFFFCASQDDMMPQEFSRELLIARYGYGLDDDNSYNYDSEDDDDDDDNTNKNGFFSWFRRSGSENEINDRIESIEGTTSIVENDNRNNQAESSQIVDRVGESSQVLGLQPMPNTSEDLMESVSSVDSVLSTLSFLLLCGDDSRMRNSEVGGSGGSRDTLASRKERREIRKIRREANAMHLETMRLERFAILEGPHGTYFGGQRKAVAMYEAFLRKCNLLPPL